MALLGRVFLRIRQPVYAQSHLPAKARECHTAGASHQWNVCESSYGGTPLHTGAVKEDAIVSLWPFLKSSTTAKKMFGT